MEPYRFHPSSGAVWMSRVTQLSLAHQARLERRSLAPGAHRLARLVAGGGATQRLGLGSESTPHP